MRFLWVAAGGALGSMARFWLADVMARLTGPRFPWGILLINVLGSFVIGFFGTLTGAGGPFAVPGNVRIFVLVGLCGGFTTFSSFSLQTFELFRAGEALLGGLNVLASVALCLAAVWAGAVLGRG
ncbi:MAG: fluoride efflux transporter CrcB [Acetobacteraceae bacterium]